MFFPIVFLGVFEVSLNSEPSCSTKLGRPAKDFEDCQVRTKRFKAAELASKYSQEHLNTDTRKRYHGCGNTSYWHAF